MLEALTTLRRLSFLALLLVGIAGVTSIANAASPLGIGSAEPSFDATGPFAQVLQWINVHQQSFYRSLTGALKSMREDPWQLSWLIALSFAYGVFHAAGPGHGKAVISSYLLANEVALRRGIVISFASAFLQGVVAITVVGLAYLVLRGTSVSMTDTTRALEIASYVLIIIFGFWLLAKKVKSTLVQPAKSTPSGMLFDSPLSDNSVTAGLFSGGSSANALERASSGRFHAVAVDHDHQALKPGSVCHECGMTHMPDASSLKGETFSLREAWSAIVAVGLRPCTGAILVMTFSLLNGLLLGGILSVFAMSIGTAIMVSILASLAVGAKQVALKLSGPGSRKAGLVASAIEVSGAIVVILLGALLLTASLNA